MHGMESWGAALFGGTLLGISSGLMLAVEGRSEGVSGMARGLFSGSRNERAWRASFLLGLASAGLLWFVLEPHKFADESGRAGPWFAIAGLLIGYGARLANGCTSGHGVIGVARGSRRSIVAIALFSLAATLTVAVFPPPRRATAELSPVRAQLATDLCAERSTATCRDAANGGAP